MQKPPSREAMRALKVEETPLLEGRYNVAPTQPVLAVREVEGSREATLLRWGLVPHRAKDTAIGAKLINARRRRSRRSPPSGKRSGRGGA